MASVSVRELLPLFSLLSIALVAPSLVSSHQFQVGGDRGWTNTNPTGNYTQSYNSWAAQNRFHVGDTLYFKYRNDSVLVVNYADYRDCAVADPIARFDNGSGAVFRLDRGGDFYFISGERENCVAGQKLVVRVMNDRESEEDGSTAPSPEESWNWGPPSLNSTVTTTMASYFATAIGGFLIVLYLLT
ncbi:mavicyanin-like [Momordica charantia]|uniref:Mavicyanin-like n=1 Tax=Momordica charantia TaxID=3673 RepID=A0A6J1CEK4_MOMCH|nr:mavicyanin-like [Momordica charantia]